MSPRIVIVFLGFCLLLGCNRTEVKNEPLERIEMVFGGSCEKLPDEAISVYRLKDPKWIAVVVGKRPKALFRVDVANDRVFEVPLSELRYDKAKHLTLHQDANSLGFQLPKDEAKYDARFSRMGVTLKFRDPSFGQIEINKIDSEHLYWDTNPPPLPYDPYYHDEISVKNFHYDPVKGTVSMDLVNKSAHPDFAMLEPQVKTGRDQYESCLENVDDPKAWEKVIDLPPHSVEHDEVKIKGYHSPDYVFHAGHEYGFQVYGRSACDGGGYGFDTPLFRMKLPTSTNLSRVTPLCGPAPGPIPHLSNSTRVHRSPAPSNLPQPSH